MRPNSLVWLSLLLLSLAGNTARADRDWHRVELEEFTLIGDAPPAELRKVAESIRLYRYALGVVMPTLAGKPPIRPRVFVLKSASFRRFTSVDRAVQGFIIPGEFSVDVVLSDSEWLSRQVIVQHELTHFYLRSSLRTVLPPWFDEGVSELLATTREHRGKLAVGFPNGVRIYTARTQPWMPLRDLLTYENRPDASGRRDSDNDAFYAQSWLLAHYALVYRKGFASKLARLVAYADSGVSPKAAIDLVFSSGELEQLELELKKYRSQDTMGYVALPLPPRSAELRVDPVAESDAQTEVATMMLRTRAIQDLKTMRVVLAPGMREEQPRALAAMASLEAHHGNLDAARGFGARCDTETRDSAALLLCGDAWLRIHLAQFGADPAAESAGFAVLGTVETADLLRARNLYGRARRADPDNVEAIFSQSSTHVGATAHDDRLLADLERAIEQLPRSVQLRTAAAQWQALGGNHARARQHLEQALLESRDLRSRHRILKLLQALETDMARAGSK